MGHDEMTDEPPAVEEWVRGLDIETTAEIDVPEMTVDQVIGQEDGVEVCSRNR